MKIGGSFLNIVGSSILIGLAISHGYSFNEIVFTGISLMLLVIGGMMIGMDYK